jgi:heme/copper-type cytochrome/quinol oxidase subunit 4
MDETYGPLDSYQVEEHTHPGPRVYVTIATILTILTAVEVALFYLEDTVGRTILVVSLLALMVVKFAIVVGWYMHLTFDHPYFRYIFVGGLMVATSIVTALGFLFGVFP